MADRKDSHVIHSRMWREEPEPDNRFAARVVYCRGYDVYGDMLGNARWVDMLYLLFRDEAPTASQADVLEALAFALANPGPRDPSVHAAMSGGVGGSTAASCLMAALAAGAGSLSGGREIFMAMHGWQHCGTELEKWRTWFAEAHASPGDIWPEPDHAPGFDPYGVSTATPVRQTLDCLVRLGAGACTEWLQANKGSMEMLAGRPLALSGIAAAAFADLGFAPEQGEMLYLLLRLPGAAAHALEQQPLGYKKFPFGELEMEGEPSGGQA